MSRDVTGYCAFHAFAGTEAERETCEDCHAMQKMGERMFQPPATPQEPEPYGPFFDPCGKCVTRTHCAHHDRCLAECVPADLRASTPSPEGQTTWKDKIAEYRALIVDMQTGTQVRSLRASELREVMAIQGTLRVLLRELDQRFPAPPTPEGTEQ